MKKDIFIVEDDQYIERVYERVFRLSGYEVTVAPDAEEALKKLEKIDPVPSIIVLDITLPRMSGIDLLLAIRENARFKSVPIAVLTNSFDDTMEQKVKAAGADLYMLKIDHEPSKIVSMIETFLHAYIPKK